MKRLLTVIVLCLSVICSANGRDIRVVTFSTKLHCENCVKKVVENISYVKGVKDLDVSLQKQEITVTYDAAKTDAATLAREIERLGYKAVEKNGDFGKSKTGSAGQQIDSTPKNR